MKTLFIFVLVLLSLSSVFSLKLIKSIVSNNNKMEKESNLLENKNLEHTSESKEKIVNSLSSLSNSNNDRDRNRKTSTDEKNENVSEENVSKETRNSTPTRSG